MALKLPLGETVAMALTTLKANRLRSLLTMLGIVIGNASVITLVGIGKGAQNLAEGQLNTLGANVLFVVPGNNDTRRQGIDFPKTLVLEDAKAIAEQVPSVRRVVPQITLNEVVQASPPSSCRCAALRWPRAASWARRISNRPAMWWWSARTCATN